MHHRLAIPGLAVIAGLLAAAVPTGASLAGDVKWPPCRCQNYGKYMLVGEVGCIRTNKGPRMARCILKGNVSFWEWLDEDCPSVNLTPVPDKPVKLSLARNAFPN